MWEKIKKFFSHDSLRNIAVTLNHFSLIEIAIILFFSYMAYDLLSWYKTVMTPENFNGVAFWGAISSIVAAIFGAIKYINDTRKK